MKITSPTGTIYVIGEELGHDDRFKLYQCSSGKDVSSILKIARRTAFNGLLDREKFVLETMSQEAMEIETEYQKIQNDGKFMNYHFYFPKLLESFISAEQGNSRINIVSFAHIAKSLTELTPIGHLLSRENVRVDPRSSAWILGKLLKLLVFTHSQNISIGKLDGDNILINRAQHYVSIFDWTSAILGNGQISADLTSQEIALVTKEVFTILGGDLTSGKLISDSQLPDEQYEKYLNYLMAGYETDTSQAHANFYQLVRSLWPTEFHKFRTYNI